MQASNEILVPSENRARANWFHETTTFPKTGVTRQAELMRLWTELISPTGSNKDF